MKAYGTELGTKLAGAVEDNIPDDLADAIPLFDVEQSDDGSFEDSTDKAIDDFVEKFYDPR